MATITMEYVDGPQVGPLQNQPGNDGRWGRGDFMINDLKKTVITGTVQEDIYRGNIGGTYVYNIGSPPPGATDIIIVGRTIG